MGGRSWRIIFRHIVPNTIGTIMVTVTFQIANAILTLAVLQYLGFGLPPTTPTWGSMISDGTTYLQDGYWWQVYPALFAIVITVRFGVRQMTLYLVLLVRMLPGILLVVPLYIVLARWGLLNTQLGLILIYAGLNTSFVVWMMQSFFEEIPRDIEEAAMVNGDSRLTALWRIVVPLAAPGLIATAIFTVIATYNDFIIALTLTSTPAAQTIPVGVSTLIGKIQIQWGPMAAAGVVGALPIVIFAIAVQRHFVRGLTLGAVK